MTNREQIRARNALNALSGKSGFKGVKGGDVLSGFPALIMGNGLLATIAFCKSKDGKKESDHSAICHAIARHLADPDIDLLPKGDEDMDKMLQKLVNSKSEQLRLCTAEALAYLNYLRRFAKAADSEDLEASK